MKKIITLILCLYFLSNVKSQDNKKYADHFTIAMIGSFTVQTVTHKVLTKNTSLSPFWTKVISSTVSSTTGFIAIYWWENSRGFYNKKDINYGLAGLATGNAFGLVITWNVTSEKYINKKEMPNEDVFDKFELVKK